MGAKTAKMIDLIRQRPGIRTVEIADNLDMDFDLVEAEIEDQLDMGIIQKHDVTAPNWRAAIAYTLTGVALPGKVETKAPAAAPKPAPPATKAPNTAISVKPLTNVEKAIAFIREQPGQVATAGQLHSLLDLKPSDATSSYLAGGLKSRQLIREGKEWRIGTGAPPPPANMPAVLQKDVAPPAAPTEPVDSADPAPPTRGDLVPLARRAAREVAREVAQALLSTPEFSCGYWSNGDVEMRRDGLTVAVLKPSEIQHLSEFLGKVAQ